MELPIVCTLKNEEHVEFAEAEDHEFQLTIERSIDPLELRLERRTGRFEPTADGDLESQTS